MRENQNESISFNGSILNTIKKLLNIDSSENSFDTDIIIQINSSFTILRQLGIGPKEGFRITGSNEQWSSFIDNDEMLDAVKTFVYLKVKLAFDPPLNSSLLESFERQIKELEWRLNVSVESEPLGGDNNE
jgi:hypothetical protein